MVTLGNGATQAVKDQISSLGSNLLMVRPGQRLGPGSRDRRGAAIQGKRRRRDRVADRRHQGRRPGTARGRHRHRQWAQLVDQHHRHDQRLFPDQQLELASGRVFEDAEEKAGAAVCLIGETVRRELFGSTTALGEQLRVKQFSCDDHRRARGQGAGGDGKRPGRHRAAAVAHGAAAGRRQSARRHAAGVDGRRQRQRARDEEPDAASARAAQAGGRRRRQLQRARHAGRSRKRCPARRRS